MRTLKDIKDITPVLISSDYPDGAIINEAIGQPGTAVINEDYNDILVNVFKILKVTGITSNGIADNETTGYQLLSALQKLPNVLNDVRQTMSLSSTTFSVPIAIDLLPSGYILFVKTSAAGIAGTTYTFKGTGALTYNFLSAKGFGVGDTVMLIINKPSNPVEAYSINQTVQPSGSASFVAGDLGGSDPFFFLPLSFSVVPQYPKYLTMYIKNADGENNTKMIFPAYVAETQIITGMPSPTDWPSMEITLYFA